MQKEGKNVNYVGKSRIFECFTNYSFLFGFELVEILEKKAMFTFGFGFITISLHL